MMDEEEKFGLYTERVSDGYMIEGSGDEIVVVADDDGDELESGERLLWEVMEYFGLYGSKHDAERLRIVREPGDKCEEREE